MNKRFFSVLVLILLGTIILFLGCENEETVNTAVVATCNWLGTDGKIELVRTDDLSAEHVVLEGVNNPKKVLVSPDGKTAYVAGSGSTIAIVDVENQTGTDLDVGNSGVFDMALSKDGERLVVGVRRIGLFLVEYSQIAVYDTSDMTLVASFNDYENNTLVYTGVKLALHPEKDVVYVLLRGMAGTTVHLRSFDFSGNVIGETQALPTQFPFSNVLDDYEIAVSPDGTMLLVTGNDIYPYTIDESSAVLSKLYEGGGIGITESGALIGDTSILFTENDKLIYVNSSGLRIDLLGINLAGGSVLLDRSKLVAEEYNPVLYDIIDFMVDLLPMISGMVTDETYQKIVDMLTENELVGIPASTVVSSTCYMLIAPVVDLSTVTGTGTYLLLTTYYDTVLDTSVLTGVRVLDECPNGIAVDEDRDQMIISYSQGDAQKIQVINKNTLAGWTFGSAKSTDLTSGNPSGINVSTYSTAD